jgi:hypothetical protein
VGRVPAEEPAGAKSLQILTRPNFSEVGLCKLLIELRKLVALTGIEFYKQELRRGMTR